MQKYVSYIFCGKVHIALFFGKILKIPIFKAFSAVYSNLEKCHDIDEFVATDN